MFSNQQKYYESLSFDKPSKNDLNEEFVIQIILLSGAYYWGCHITESRQESSRLWKKTFQKYFKIENIANSVTFLMFCLTPCFFCKLSTFSLSIPTEL